MHGEGQPSSQPKHIVFSPTRNRRFLLALLLGLLAISVWLAWPFRAAIVLALFLGYILYPFFLKLRKPLRWRWAAALVVLIIVAAAIIIPLALIGWELYDQARELQAQPAGSGYRQQAIEVLVGLGVDEAEATSRIDAGISTLSVKLQGLLVSSLSNVLDIVIGLVVFFILLFYVLVDGPRLVDFYRMYVPLSPRRRERLLEQTGDRVRAILLGSFAVMAIQGVTAGIGWWIFGLPSPIFWGFVMTILAILPFLGPQLVTIPAGVLAILQGDYYTGFGILIWTFVAVGLIDDLVRPWLIGKRAGVHPALILIGTLGGIEVLGLAGFVLGPLLLGLVEPVLRTWARTTPDTPPAQLSPEPPGDPPGAARSLERVNSKANRF